MCWYSPEWVTYELSFGDEKDYSGALKKLLSDIGTVDKTNIEMWSYIIEGSNDDERKITLRIMEDVAEEDGELDFRGEPIKVHDNNPEETKGYFDGFDYPTMRIDRKRLEKIVTRRKRK